MKHEQELAEVKRDFTEEVEQLNFIISQMGQSLYQINETMKQNSRGLLETFLDKDVRIQELEEMNDELDQKLNYKENSNAQVVDISDYNQVITINSAMKSNVKSLNARIAELESSNNELTLKSKYFLRLMYLTFYNYQIMSIVVQQKALKSENSKGDQELLAKILHYQKR